MTSRVNHFKTIPGLVKSLSDVTLASHKSAIDSMMKHLIDIRASQLNGCTFCVDMHIKQAKLDGERELRIYHVAVWRESPLFSAKEKAALALTEALTRINAHGVSDELYHAVSEHFSEVEISELAMAISVINSWNRLMVLSQMEPGALDKAYGLDRADLN
ncbi:MULTISPECIES: carboxymuconolactone decarboxylase family protein [Pantoea]|jgi:AhpD family alkylhydroperoxidase|uniref:carboxymuconolactone decarboxylase family protein n=1 Tax=Pantoea TaxID=53335 RepID=UPI001C05ED8F|nr:MULTISPECIES: carboxymuconolactone decarboxylase family protein [Pantoea]